MKSGSYKKTENLYIYIWLPSMHLNTLNIKTSTWNMYWNSKH